jgi:hypothetical protein
VPSYLDDTFLGGAEDDNYEVGAADNLPAVYQGPQAPAVASDSIRLPGGIVIPKQTAILLAIVIAVAIWWLLKSKKRKD